jgi:hypothetical protein
MEITVITPDRTVITPGSIRVRRSKGTNERAGDHAAVLRELHELQKSGLDPDVPSLESAARTLGGAKQWKQAADSALALTELGLQASEPRAFGVWVKALARRRMLRRCLDVISQADVASHELPPNSIRTGLRLLSHFALNNTFETWPR